MSVKTTWTFGVLNDVMKRYLIMVQEYFLFLTLMISLKADICKSWMTNLSNTKWKMSQTENVLCFTDILQSNNLFNSDKQMRKITRSSTLVRKASNKDHVCVLTEQSTMNVR